MQNQFSDNDSPEDNAPILGSKKASQDKTSDRQRQTSSTQSTSISIENDQTVEPSATMGGSVASSSSIAAAEGVSARPSTQYHVPMGGAGRHLDDVSREFYRRATLRATTVMIGIALVCAFTVPIVAVMIVPVGAGVVWWLRSPSRFVSGGDPTRCFNRDSCLNFYIILLCATMVVNVIDIIFLLTELFSSPTGTESTLYSPMLEPRSRTHEVGVTAPNVALYTSDAQYHAAHKSLLFLDLAINTLSALGAGYSLFVARKLQGLLSD